jgi:hypothetical protein
MSYESTIDRKSFLRSPRCTIGAVEADENGQDRRKEVSFTFFGNLLGRIQKIACSILGIILKSFKPVKFTDGAEKNEDGSYKSLYATLGTLKNKVKELITIRYTKENPDFAQKKEDDERTEDIEKIDGAYQSAVALIDESRKKGEGFSIGNIASTVAFVAAAPAA